MEAALGDARRAADLATQCLFGRWIIIYASLGLAPSELRGWFKNAWRMP
jgi:hypothetical protein